MGEHISMQRISAKARRRGVGRSEGRKEESESVKKDKGIKNQILNMFNSETTQTLPPTEGQIQDQHGARLQDEGGRFRRRLKVRNVCQRSRVEGRPRRQFIEE